MVYFIEFIKRNFLYLILIIALFVFALILKYYYFYELYLLDERIYLKVFDFISSNNITSFMKLITHLGSTLFLSILIIVTFIFIKDKKISINLAYSLVVTYIFNYIFKITFLRERPSKPLIDKPSNYSFPSSHTMCSTVFYGLSIYYIIKYMKNKFLKYLLASILIIFIILIGLSRMYLRVHYFSDVLFGFLFGLLFLLVILNEIKE